MEKLELYKQGVTCFVTCFKNEEILSVLERKKLSFKYRFAKGVYDANGQNNYSL